MPTLQVSREVLSAIQSMAAPGESPDHLLRRALAYFSLGLLTEAIDEMGRGTPT